MFAFKAHSLSLVGRPPTVMVFTRRRHWRPFATVTVLAFVLFASVTQQLSNGSKIEGKKARQQLKGLENSSGWGRVESTHSRLSGPGSSPPRCISKCGRCRPCEPVHVSIHPGLSMPLEYYPEAWRCQCGNKLFMP